jgi:hypothetical protein
MKLIQSILLTVGISLLLCITLRSTTLAIDHGVPDTLALEATIVSSDVTGSVIRVDLYGFNDADNWVGVGAGFQWSGNGLHLDSVQLSPLSWASFNGCFMSPSPCLPSQSEIDSSNAYQLFRAGLFTLTGNGLDSSSGRKHLLSYWFTHEPGSINFSIDTIVYSGGTVMRVLSEESGIPYQPVWAGTLVFAPTDVNSEEVAAIPYQFTLHQNYPNPFNPSTTISFSLPRTSHVQLDIIDVLGRIVASPLSEVLPPGEHRVQWNGRDNNGAQVSSGIYFSRISDGGSSQSRPMMLLK